MMNGESREDPDTKSKHLESNLNEEEDEENDGVLIDDEDDEDAYRGPKSGRIMKSKQTPTSPPTSIPTSETNKDLSKPNKNRARIAMPRIQHTSWQKLEKNISGDYPTRLALIFGDSANAIMNALKDFGVTKSSQFAYLDIDLFIRQNQDILSESDKAKLNYFKAHKDEINTKDDELIKAIVDAKVGLNIGDVLYCRYHSQELRAPLGVNGRVLLNGQEINISKWVHTTAQTEKNFSIYTLLYANKQKLKVFQTRWFCNLFGVRYWEGDMDQYFSPISIVNTTTPENQVPKTKTAESQQQHSHPNSIVSSPSSQFVPRSPQKQTNNSSNSTDNLALNWKQNPYTHAPYNQQIGLAPSFSFSNLTSIPSSFPRLKLDVEYYVEVPAFYQAQKKQIEQEKQQQQQQQLQNLLHSPKKTEPQQQQQLHQYQNQIPQNSPAPDPQRQIDSPESSPPLNQPPNGNGKRKREIKNENGTATANTKPRKRKSNHKMGESDEDDFNDETYRTTVRKNGDDDNLHQRQRRTNKMTSNTTVTTATSPNSHKQATINEVLLEETLRAYEEESEISPLPSDDKPQNTQNQQREDSNNNETAKHQQQSPPQEQQSISEKREVVSSNSNGIDESKEQKQQQQELLLLLHESQPRPIAPISTTTIEQKQQQQQTTTTTTTMNALSFIANQAITNH